MKTIKDITNDTPVKEALQIITECIGKEDTIINIRPILDRNEICLEFIFNSNSILNLGISYAVHIDLADSLEVLVEHTSCVPSMAGYGDDYHSSTKSLNEFASWVKNVVDQYQVEDERELSTKTIGEINSVEVITSSLM